MKPKKHRYLHFRILSAEPQNADVFRVRHEGVVRVLTNEQPEEKIAQIDGLHLTSYDIVEIEYTAAFAYHEVVWKQRDGTFEAEADGNFLPGEAVYEPKGHQ